MAFHLLPPDTLPRVELPRPTTSMGWVRHYTRRLVIGDLLAMTLAAGFALLARFPDLGHSLRVGSFSVSYTIIALASIPGWLLVLAAGSAYEQRMVGSGTEEFRRVLRASLHFFVIVATLSFVAKARVARSFVFGVVPLAVVLTLLGRQLNRRWLRHRRRHGEAVWRVLVAGDLAFARSLTAHLHRTKWAGLRVTGVCLTGSGPKPGTHVDVAGERIPVVGDADDLKTTVRELGVDVLAVAGGGDLGGTTLKDLSWSLEGSGVDLIVAPSLADVAGPRLAVQPVSGLPLLHLAEPRFHGPSRVAKDAIDRIGSLLALIVAAPVMVLVAVLIKVTSPGPVFFRQTRLGRLGEPFTIWKFRTMLVDAEERREALLGDNELEVLFKIRRDPRITRIGRWLRRFSIDELPQLINVLRGEMSLVGPRPPLPEEVAEYGAYGDHVTRRLLVKPGITGLWQTSGRADLPWDEAVRLDLYYVDHWSPSLDMVIVVRTIKAVLVGRGAY